MLPPDRGTRNLLPLLIDRQSEIVQADDDGGEVRLILAPESSTSHSTNPAIGPAQLQVEPIHQDSGLSPQAYSPSAVQNAASHGSSPSIGLSRTDAVGGDDRMSIEIDDGINWSGSFSAHGSPSGVAPATAPMPIGTAPHPTGDGITEEEQGGKDPDSSSSDPVSATGAPPVAPTPSEPPAPVAIPIAVPDGDDIHIVQTAFVDQDADVLLNGWMGDSKIRVFMDNDADMVQDVDIALDIDDNDRLFLRLDQSMIINQETEIDLDIYEVEGVLYVDLYLRNEVDIVQDTELDLMMDGWHGTSQFFVNNHLDVRQDVDVDVDIEDELEEKFAIKVAIGVKQAVDADQDADIDINYADGGFGIDIDAVQTATIDQDTTLRIDFSVV